MATIKLKKDLQTLRHGEIASNEQEFHKKSIIFEAGSIFSNDWNQKDMEKPAPRYGWMMRVDHSWVFCHHISYILNDWDEHPDFFELLEVKL